MTLDKTIKKVLQVSRKEKKTLPLQLVKLAEEHGELAAAVLMQMKLKGTTMTRAEVKENVLEEGCDCLLMILSILTKAGFNENQIVEMTNKKILKWEKRL